MAEIRTLRWKQSASGVRRTPQTLAERAVAGEADGTELTASQDIIPTWRQRDFSAVPIGTPYQWKGLVYKLWQQHDATVPAGLVARSGSESLGPVPHHGSQTGCPLCPGSGEPGMYQPGEVCTESGHVWRCTQSNTVYPPSQLPGSWTDLGTVEEVQG